MQVARVGNPGKLETQGTRMRLSANAGSPGIVFPREMWENLLADATTFDEPASEDLAELERKKEHLDVPTITTGR